jgi:hypothetical protein
MDTARLVAGVIVAVVILMCYGACWGLWRAARGIARRLWRR